MTDSVAWKVTQLCGLLLELPKKKQQEAIDLLSAILQPTVEEIDQVARGLVSVHAQQAAQAWEPSVIDEALGDYVWCDFYGSVHENAPDPEREGPREVDDEDPYYEDNPGWAREIRESEYGNQELWFFTCPGPHKNLQVKE